MNFSLTFCQTGPRSALRGDAQPAFTDCASALASGRDGDACAGDYFCHAMSGHGTTTWCDDGILRIGPDYPFYHL